MIKFLFPIFIMYVTFSKTTIMFAKSRYSGEIINANSEVVYNVYIYSKPLEDVGMYDANDGTSCIISKMIETLKIPEATKVSETPKVSKVSKASNTSNLSKTPEVSKKLRLPKVPVLPMIVNITKPKCHSIRLGFTAKEDLFFAFDGKSSVEAKIDKFLISGDVEILSSIGRRSATSLPMPLSKAKDDGDVSSKVKRITYKKRSNSDNYAEEQVLKGRRTQIEYIFEVDYDAEEVVFEKQNDDIKVYLRNRIPMDNEEVKNTAIKINDLNESSIDMTDIPDEHSENSKQNAVLIRPFRHII